MPMETIAGVVLGLGRLIRRPQPTLHVHDVENINIQLAAASAKTVSVNWARLSRDYIARRTVPKMAKLQTVAIHRGSTSGTPGTASEHHFRLLPPWWKTVISKWTSLG